MHTSLMGPIPLQRDPPKTRQPPMGGLKLYVTAWRWTAPCCGLRDVCMQGLKPRDKPYRHCTLKEVTACRYTDTGFLVNEVAVDGALLCLRDLWVRWAPSSVAEVTPASLAMLLLLRPMPGESRVQGVVV